MAEALSILGLESKSVTVASQRLREFAKCTGAVATATTKFAKEFGKILTATQRMEREAAAFTGAMENAAKVVNGQRAPPKKTCASPCEWQKA